jgi:hypothetical protein
VVFRTLVFESGAKLLRNDRAVSFVLHPESLMHGIPGAKPLTCPAKQFFYSEKSRPGKLHMAGQEEIAAK